MTGVTEICGAAQYGRPSIYDNGKGVMARKANRRIGVRTKAARPATLIDGTTALDCMIEDFSNTGFLITAARDIAIGQILEIKCELYPGQVLLCKIEVTRRAGSCLGTEILEIAKESDLLLASFLQDYQAPKLRYGT